MGIIFLVILISGLTSSNLIAEENVLISQILLPPPPQQIKPPPPQTDDVLGEDLQKKRQKRQKRQTFAGEKTLQGGLPRTRGHYGPNQHALLHQPHLRLLHPRQAIVRRSRNSL